MSQLPKFLYSTPQDLLSTVTMTKGEVLDGVDILSQRPLDECTFNNTVAALSRLLARAQDVFNVVMFLQSVDPRPEMRKASEDASNIFTQMINTIFTNPQLYQRIEQTHSSDPTDIRLRQFILNGFPSHSRTSNTNNPPDRISHQHLGHCANHPSVGTLAAEFENNLREFKPKIELSRAQLRGVTENLLNETRQPNGLYQIKYEDMNEVISQCQLRSIRAQVMNLTESYCPQNGPVLVNLIMGRTHVARDQGWANWADRAVASTMAKTPGRVIQFLDQIQPPLKKSVTTFARNLSDFAGFPIKCYDVDHYHVKWVQQNLGRNVEEIWAYFELESVVSKMLHLFGNLLGIAFTRISVPTWDPQVQAYQVTDTREGFGIGTLLCDLFPRPGKISYTATWVLRDGYFLPNYGQVLPVVALVCNFANPKLSLDGVETVLHEFGHALHGLLTGSKSRYAELGFNMLPIDWIEVPSQLMEIWARDPQVLRALSEDPVTGRPLSESLAQDIVSLYREITNYEWLTLVALSRFDNLVYRQSIESIPTLMQQFQSIIQADCPVIPHFDTFPFVWGHIGTTLYAGLYFIYLWDTAIAADLHEVFVQSGNVMNPKIGRKYRELILEPGNSVYAPVLIERFLGRPFNLKALFALISGEN
jgi:thimet oligopeptidase